MLTGDFFMNMAEDLGNESTCNRAQVGCVIVRHNRPISMGYNGSPPGFPHCKDIGCLEIEGTVGCQLAVHAEQNAIAWAARHGISVEGAWMYTTLKPCRACANLILQAGISRVFYLHLYRDDHGLLDDISQQFTRRSL